VRASGKSLVVVGAGGNIGSHVAPHVARMPGVARVTLIDKDVYERKNLVSQSITPRDVGRSKANVQARSLRRINPALIVLVINDAVENVPLGRLRANVLLACLDSRRSRQYVNEAAWHLGVTWIDAGVEAGGLLARVNVYLPGEDNPCLECAWDQRDYDALEQTYPCFDGDTYTFATNAPSSLGALAASLQAIECQKLLRGEFGDGAISKQIVLDALHHKQYLTTFRRNPDCRLFDHEPWKIQPLNVADKATLDDLITVMKRPVIVAGRSRLSVEGKRFVGQATCRGCGSQRRMGAFLSLANGARTKCVRCGGMMFATADGLAESIDLSATVKSRSLRSMGLRAGDVFSVASDHERVHFEIGEQKSSYASRRLE
jgi:molybdopterin/thiamine biosynthesis adenylyltransferase